jgi:hypothetical protein
MQPETINNQNSGNCAVKTPTATWGMRSHPESLTGVTFLPRGNENSYRPIRRSDIIVRYIEGEAVVLDRHSGFIHQLNHTAIYIWDRCNGQLTTAEIVSQLMLTFEVNESMATHDVSTMLSHFHSLRLLEPC